MVSVLLHRLPMLVGLLRAAQFARRGFSVDSASTVPELIRRAAATQPNVVIVHTSNADTDQLVAVELRKVVRARSSLFLLAAPDPTSAALERMDGYDGFLSLEDPERRLERMMLPWSSLWTRRERRMAVRIPIEIGPPSALPVAGTADDLSRSGARLQIDRLPTSVGPYRLRFHRQDGRSVRVMARATWAASHAGSVAVGVRFLDASFDTQTALADLAAWELIDGPVIHLRGEISEETSLWTLATQIINTPRIDLGRVVRVNFVGAFRLVEFFSSAPAFPKLRLSRVPTVLSRLPRVASLIASKCIMESYYVTYDCARCNIEVPVLCVPSENVPPASCPLCGGPLSASSSLPLAAESVATH